MSRTSQFSLFLVRLAMGWMFLYAGLTKVIDPKWTAAGYLANAKTFPAFFQWFLLPQNIGWVNVVNEWGLTFLGISLILGLGVRFSSILGAGLMLLYYLPILQFPYPNPNSYIVDQHAIYIMTLLFFAAIRAGRYYGLEKWCESLPICRNYPSLHKFWG